ncbi:nucleoside-diphosphate sugar epimerase/dehydratase [Rhizobium sp. RU36D]|uniref:polysaccharide biosynthesis protein n=1 Tax=Rhizobium sp. RU36D TaxID=1907415 RepID=UPI0009D7F12A|nr:nucleoside-diphosphate sugar epimerase/dehydratase [Rhizobium sp. RU36D]SMC44628.1 NDP-sugar epimerase, includes UDP-GlcNAc-inverting 4,6-dehydratase FlaA1 and capsular polysaccharide biosynthesis protein EpsC [Rhizobium sp. RU36D]
MASRTDGRKPGNRYAIRLLALPRVAKRVLAVLVDASLCVLTVWLAYYLRLDEWVPLSGIMWLPVPVSLALALPIFITMGLYRAIFRYAGLSAFVTVVQAVAIYGLAFMTIFTAVSVPGVPRTVGILQPLLLLIAVALSRMGTRYWLGDAYRSILRTNASQTRVVIYGAGTAGRQLAAALSNSNELKVHGFLDDDPLLQGSIMNGLPIYNPQDLPGLVETVGIRDVLLAIPSVSRKRRAEIADQLSKAKVTIRTVPDLTALAQGHITVSALRELQIEDLLGRDAIAPDKNLLDKSIRGKVVLVTGAGGSIGSELCRQILVNGPAGLLLYEQSEYSLYAIHSELMHIAEKAGLSDVRLVPILGNVNDEKRLRHVLQTWKPQTLYHAAAYKHVPMVEVNVAAGVCNNAFGTLTAALAAIDLGVSDFVLISTDKAVRPPNVMGASKRLAEMILQALAHRTDKPAGSCTNFSMVRFGNVLGSSGSVVPLFRQQILDGGPVTVTDPEVTRYFMTIPEAAQLVIQAGAMSEGGDVFLLDMGEPVKIIDLAYRMVELSGLTVQDEMHPDGDIAISIIGLRPGEKLYEELLIGDNVQTTDHPRIMKGSEDFLPWTQLEPRLVALDTVLRRNDPAEIRAYLQELVSGYKPNGEVCDLPSAAQ